MVDFFSYQRQTTITMAKSEFVQPVLDFAQLLSDQGILDSAKQFVNLLVCRILQVITINMLLGYEPRRKRRGHSLRAHSARSDVIPID